MIYLDNAATTKVKPREVIRAVTKALEEGMGNAGRGAGESSLGSARVLFDTRVALGELFGAESPMRISFASNSTEALNTAIMGVFDPGCCAVTTAMEHNSVLRPLFRLRDEGMKLIVLPVDEKGRISLTELEEVLKAGGVKAFVCTHASNLTGNVNDLYNIGRICRRYGVLLIVDASQSAGVFPIDVQEMNIDILCFTGHKGLLGPMGTGGLYVREGVFVRPLKEGGSGIHTFDERHPLDMPEALEAGTQNAHGIAGLCAALEYIKKTGVDNIREKEQTLAKRFYDGIKDLPGIIFYGDYEAKDRAPIVTINIEDYDSAKISDILLMDYGIETRSGGHCAPLMHKAFGTVEQGSVRFSFSHKNTIEETDAAIQAIRDMVL